MKMPRKENKNSKKFSKLENEFAALRKLDEESLV
jgi:hypothetical protein